MYLGIDLGTSNSAVVGYDGEQLTVFKTSDGSDVLPSALLINPQGRRFVGKRAYEQAALSPDNVAIAFKRMMGTSTPLKFSGAGLALSAEEASAEVLRTLVGQAALETGGAEITGTVITMPAAFDQMQTEATLRAAELAGIQPIALLHEPIAAAMGSMASAKARSGQFLVYDLGGGTFDAALVQSSGGSVSVVANEGIKMLGGRDHDRALLGAIVAPWLEETFDLDADYQLDPTFSKMLRRIQLRLEQAKIELTTREQTQLFVSDDELRVRDRSGADIYIDVELTRGQLESLIAPDIERSIALCVRMIEDNGFQPDDIDRVVLIGGPSKMPIVRNRVPEALGIAVDLSTDPMTAVARGAAIYAESREWGETRSTRKASRAMEVASAGVRFDFPARTSEETARLRITGCADHRVRIDAEDGWSSGEFEVASEHRLTLPLSRLGENIFRATLSKPGATTEVVTLKIQQTAASSAGIPLTHTLAVAVEQGEGEGRRDRLEPIAQKGQPLPLSGSRAFRSARAMVGGTDDSIDIGFFETAPDIMELDLAQFVGSFQLRADQHLDVGQTLRAGSKIDVHWQIDENGIVLATIGLPDIGASFDSQRFYSSVAGHRSFSDDEGGQYLASLVEDANSALADAQEALSHAAWLEVEALKERVAREQQKVEKSEEPEVRRQAAEELMAVRQDLHRLTHADENRLAILNRDLATIEELFEGDLRARMDVGDAGRFDQLSRVARQALDAGNPEGAETPIAQMRSLMFKVLMEMPEILVDRFERLVTERHVVADKGVHDRLVQVGGRCISANDWPQVRQVIVEMQRNLVVMPVGRSSDALSGLLIGR